VYVQTAEGQYEPREIRVGREASGYYEVVSGIREGENVVTSANFLIDSESKIRATLQGTK
jgi:Cu(I)/Ag(I) efflux system membrane fusion protein